MYVHVGYHVFVQTLLVLQIRSPFYVHCIKLLFYSLSLSDTHINRLLMMHFAQLASENESETVTTT